MGQPPGSTAAIEDDPVWLHAKREAFFILGLWCTCFVYTISYCYLFGYLSHEPLPNSTGTSIDAVVGPLERFNRAAATLETPLGLGVPDWVFYGILVPWVICILLSFWFCLFYFVEDDLEDGATNAPEQGAAP